MVWQYINEVPVAVLIATNMVKLALFTVKCCANIQNLLREIMNQN